MSKSSIKERLVGTWTLKSYVETNVSTGEKTMPMGDSPSGFIIYSNDGYMSAQLCASARQNFADGDMFEGADAEYRAAGQSYLAYSGPYEVNEAAGIVHHEIGVSLFPNWAGARQSRVVTLIGDELTLSFEAPQQSRGALRSADLIWRRAVKR